MAGYMKSLQKRMSDFKGTIVNSAIAGGTVAFEEILNHAVYYCPCVEISELGSCNSTSSSQNSWYECTRNLNSIYGLVFIAIPAVALFFLSLAAHPSLWKIVTGRRVRDRAVRARRDKICVTIVGVCTRSMIAPVVWVCYSLLDGKYYACSVTPLPYHFDGRTYISCQDVARAARPVYSDAYRDNSSYSQMVGWIVLGCTAFVALIGYTLSRCFYPMTYYHAKYYDLYRMHEENEFDDEMNKKAQLHAENNVKKFMEKHRAKKLWDRISTIFRFHRNCDQRALYSYLHEFILDEERNDSPVSGNGVDAVATEATESNVMETKMLDAVATEATQPNVTETKM